MFFLMHFKIIFFLMKRDQEYDKFKHNGVILSKKKQINGIKHQDTYCRKVFHSYYKALTTFLTLQWNSKLCFFKGKIWHTSFIGPIFIFSKAIALSDPKHNSSLMISFFLVWACFTLLAFEVRSCVDYDLFIAG